MNLNEKIFFVVTGASRGIGKTMAIEISKKLKPDSVVLLLARNLANLEATSAEINKLTNNQLKVFNYSVDFETANEAQFKDIFAQVFNAINLTPTQFERAVIIHNAGTVGDVTKNAVEASNTEEWTRYLHTNLFATIALNCVFFGNFKNEVPKLVINISSLCGIEPFKGTSFYCTGKAAREMYFKVLATERSDTLVLNYAPGAIDTDMTVLLQNESINEELAELFKQQRDTNTMLTTQQTTQKMLEILQLGKFKSGDHVDYWHVVISPMI